MVKNPPSINIDKFEEHHKILDTLDMSTTAEANIETSDLSCLVGKKVMLPAGVPCLPRGTPAISGVALSVAKNDGVLYYVVQFDVVQPTPFMTLFFQNLMQQFGNVVYLRKVYDRYVVESPVQG